MCKFFKTGNSLKLKSPQKWKFFKDAVSLKHKLNITNKVTNCKFFAGKAEDILPNLLRDVDSKEVICLPK